ncbi:Na+/H+ antiporter [Ilyomonas limi]|uniref:Na+/H+ antiporter n=1 Tax=Ilyomonas limi TaxID=2575867 RepID=A0A4U3KSM1_9BACT|nr:Na+/H+ antiporter [Ilyomonas limi]TKK65301.1 Na+/H+ antiporter [Ilyomonas limi]
MENVYIEYIYLILIILGLVMLAQRLKVSYPIVLVLGGLVLSFTDGFSSITINPGMIFFIFLPPLLYEAAWQTSWKEFWRWRRVITSFAFPIVIVTSFVVALISQAFIPGFTLALGFLLGGIISPPDAISATSIMRSVKAPKSLVSIVEGESLMNDASSLIVFRFALIAITTGQFVFQEAVANFFVVIIMGIAVGLAVAFGFYNIHRRLPTTPSIDIVLSFVTPYCMYYFAERFHFSGVLAVVSGGLFLSIRREKMLSHLSRVQSTNVWSTVGFVLNGLIFLLIGLQLPGIVKQLGGLSLSTAIGYGLLISGVLIVTRLLCTFGAVLFTRFMSHFITVADRNPGWKAPILFGWAGMRGVVSLAAALSIPVYIDNDQTVLFPQRNLILFITFIVILVTLVFQGLTLPWLIRKLKMEDRFSPISPEKQEMIIQKKIAHQSLLFLEERYKEEVMTNEHVGNLKARLSSSLSYFTSSFENEPAYDDSNPMKRYQHISLEMLDKQRELLHQMNHRSEFDEEIIRKHLSLLDLEETKLREKLPQDAHVK